MSLPRLAMLAAAGAAVAAFLRSRGARTTSASSSSPAPAPAPAEEARETPVAEVVEQEFRCECGEGYRVSGEGRHRVYWPADATAKDPLLDPKCAACGRELPRD